MTNIMRDEIIQKRGYADSISGDDLSLKISSYPTTAKYLAKRLSPHGNTICELCCGVGISLIEFSHRFDKVIGLDNSSQVIESAQKNLHNAGITNCELLLGNADDPSKLSRINADIVAYDIPYWSDHNDAAMDKNPQLARVIELINANITKNIVIYSPPHISYDDIAKITSIFEYQEVWIDDKHDRNFIYFGDLVEKPTRTKIILSNHPSE
jgi:methylase of polypeptide subunit release factors